MPNDILLSRKTTLKVGGKAKFFSEPTSQEELLSYIIGRKGEPILILGGGSNVLVSDKGYNGHVIGTRNLKSIQLLGDSTFEFSPGVMVSPLVNSLAKEGYGGIEYLSHMPATIGGCVVNNAGVDERRCIQKSFVSLKAFDRTVGKVVSLGPQEMDFAYRHSTVRTNQNLVILSVRLKLELVPKRITFERIAKHLQQVVSNHDRTGPSAGSIFVHPNTHKMRLLQGMTIGEAMWSKSRNNWIVAKKGSKASDIINLIKLARAHGVKARLEIQCYGF